MQRNPVEPVLLDRKAVAAMTGIQERTLSRAVEAGRFPAPIRTGTTNGLRWLKSDLDQWIADRVSERDAALAVRQMHADPHPAAADAANAAKAEALGGRRAKRAGGAA